MLFNQVTTKQVKILAIKRRGFHNLGVEIHWDVAFSSNFESITKSALFHL